LKSISSWTRPTVVVVVFGTAVAVVVVPTTVGNSDQLIKGVVQHNKKYSGHLSTF